MLEIERLKLVKIENFKVFKSGERGRAVRLPGTWGESVQPKDELPMFVDGESGALIVPDPARPLNPARSPNGESEKLQSQIEPEENGDSEK